MNRNILIIVGIAILILVVGGGLFIANQNNSNPEEMANKDGQMMDDNEDSMEKDDPGMDKSGDSRYIEYSKASLDSASGRRVLYFYANWCPICRPADENFKENSEKIPDDLTLIRVNYNDTDTDQEEKDLAKKHDITYQHTYVQIDENGNEIAKWNGGQIEELLAQVK